MRKGLVGSVATLLAGTGLALAQAPTSVAPDTMTARALATFGANPGRGALGGLGTLSAISGSDLTHEEQSGGRFTFGAWVNQYRDLGIEGSFFFLGPDTTDRGAVSSAGANAPILA